MQGVLGRKVGMTQVFDGEGRHIPVTVLQVGPCVVLQRKTMDNDGYEAVQLGFEEVLERRATKPIVGHCKKRAGVGPRRVMREFPIEEGDVCEVGQQFGATVFENVKLVTVTGTSKGRGFQGAVKRYGFAGGPKTHGGHSKRRPGSVGAKAKPARVRKGQRMPGHMGNRRVTQKNLKVVDVRGAENLLLVEGSVPGRNGGLLIVRKAQTNARIAQ